MSTILAASSVISMLSGAIFGTFADMFKQYSILFMSLALVLASVSLIVMRFLTNYAVYFTFSLFYWALYCPIDLLGNAVILRAWGERNTGPMYAIHFGFGLGSTIGPFIARPFLSPEDSLINCTECMTSAVPATEEPSRFPEGSRIEIPYIIIGLFTLAMGITLFVIHIIGPPNELRFKLNAASDERKPLKEVCHPTNCSNGSIPCTVLFLICFFLFYVFNCGRAIGLNAYMFTFATESELKFSKDSAIVLSSIYMAFYMMGRLVSVVLSRCFTVQVMLIACIIIVCFTQAGLAIWGVSEQIPFAAFSCAVAFFGSPIWPAGMSWTDKYITVTSTSLLLMPFGGSIGGFIFNPIYGALLDDKSYSKFLYIMLLASLLLFGNMIVAQLAGVKKGSRFDIKEDIDVVIYSKSD